MEDQAMSSNPEDPNYLEIPEHEAETLAEASWATDLLSPEDFAELQEKGSVIGTDREAIALVVVLQPAAAHQMIKDLYAISTGTATVENSMSYYSFAWWVAGGFLGLLDKLGYDTSDLGGTEQ